jgi:hypothetical protein
MLVIVVSVSMETALALELCEMALKVIVDFSLHLLWAVPRASAGSPLYFVVACVPEKRAAERAAIGSLIHAMTSPFTKATRFSPNGTALGNISRARQRLIAVLDRLVSLTASFRLMRTGVSSGIRHSFAFGSG